MTRPQLLAEPVPMAEALSDVERFTTTFDVLEDGPEVTAHLMTLCGAVLVAGRQVHDANIVATMRAHGETRPLTANAADFRRFEPKIAVILILRSTGPKVRSIGIVAGPPGARIRGPQYPSLCAAPLSVLARRA